MPSRREVFRWCQRFAEEALSGNDKIAEIVATEGAGYEGLEPAVLFMRAFISFQRNDLESSRAMYLQGKRQLERSSGKNLDEYYEPAVMSREDLDMNEYMELGPFKDWAIVLGVMCEKDERGEIAEALKGQCENYDMKQKDKARLYAVQGTVVGEECWKESERYFRRAYDTWMCPQTCDPLITVVYERYAHGGEEDGRLDAGREVLGLSKAQATVFAPETGASWTRYARALVINGKTDEARDALKTARTKGPPWNQELLGNLEEEIGR